MKYFLRSYHGGLGDELQFSTLPEALNNLGHEVYLLKDPQGKHVKPFRNEEIKKLVWDTNPHILGEMEGPWNLGDIPAISYKNTTGCFIQNWERAFGVDSGFNLRPQVYLAPAPTEQFDVLIELSSITLKYNESHTIKKVCSMLDLMEWIDCRVPPSGAKIAQIQGPHQNNAMTVGGVQAVSGNLIDIWNMLCSCKVFITLNSGLHSLAAAAKRFNPNLHIICLLPGKDADWIQEQKKFVYPGVRYIGVYEPISY